MPINYDGQVCFAVHYEKMSDGSAVFGIVLLGRDSPEQKLRRGAMKTNPEQLQLYLSIQVTKSHELALIRQFLTQVSRAQFYCSLSTERKSCCNWQSW